MSTFLEFVVSKYLGAPSRVLGDGQSFWPCPICDHDRFHTMPVHTKYKHRAKCYSCGLLEDAAGLLAELHSGRYPGWAAIKNYSDRYDLLRSLEREWQKANEEI